MTEGLEALPCRAVVSGICSSASWFQPGLRFFSGLMNVSEFFSGLLPASKEEVRAVEAEVVALRALVAPGVVSPRKERLA